MSLLRDLVATLGDALRLSSDLMRYKLEAQTQALKRGAGRLGLCLSLYLAAALVIGDGRGLRPVRGVHSGSAGRGSGVWPD